MSVWLRALLSCMRAPLSPSTYAGVLLSVAALLMLPLAASALFLAQSGELRSPGWIASWLQRSQGLYGTALNSNAREVALSIYRLRRPEVSVLSSSRGTEFRQQFFTSTFSCACMVMSNLEEGHQFFDAVAPSHLPRVLILGLDFWWFSRSDDHTTRPPPVERGEVPVTRTNLIAPYEWVRDGKLSIGDLFAVMGGWSNRSPLSREPKLGIQAIKKSFGTRPDGSWAVLSHAANIDLHPAVLNINRLITEPERLLDEKRGRYAPDQELDPAKVAIFVSLVRKLQARGTKVVAILLPIAPPLLDTMRASDRYHMLGDLVRVLKETSREIKFEFYDELDPRAGGGTTCEFQDPHHGGNALYARILHRIVEQNPASALTTVVDAASVARIASEYAGRVVATLGEELPAFREQDFLGIGCRK